jgi:hypothetical protein
MNPRTVWRCHPIWSMISWSVAPFFRRSIATTWAVLLPSRARAGSFAFFALFAPLAGFGAGVASQNAGYVSQKAVDHGSSDGWLQGAVRTTQEDGHRAGVPAHHRQIDIAIVVKVPGHQRTGNIRDVIGNGGLKRSVAAPKQNRNRT